MRTRLKKERAALQTRLGQVHSAINDAAECFTALAEEQERLAAIEKRLAANEFAADEQRAMATVQEEIRTLAYDQQNHEQVRKDVTDLSSFDELKMKLEEAEKSITSEKEALLNNEATLSELETGLHNYQHELEKLISELYCFAGIDNKNKIPRLALPGIKNSRELIPRDP